MILRNPRQPSPADPLVLLPGGPGAIGSNLAALVAPVLGTFTTRDLILFDDRGTGRSEPHVCAGAERAFADTIAADLRGSRFAEGVAALLLDCRHELDSKGVAAESFGTNITVEDMERIRRALGIERWNIHGVSYGTRLALSYAARYPEAVRSLVLDSVVNMAAKPWDTPPGYKASMSQVIRLCEADTSCAKTHPHLRTSLQHALERLESRPLFVEVDPALGLNGNQVVLNRADFEWLLFATLYRREAYGHIPALIEAVRDGRTSVLTPLLQGHVSEWHARTVSLFGFAAVICRDTPDTMARSRTTAGFQWLELRSVCPHWSSGAEPQVVRGRTKIPTLILSGETDPITPPRYARDTARALGPAAHWVRFPATGHGVASQSACARSIMGAFLDNPDSMPDPRCASQPPPVPFE